MNSHSILYSLEFLLYTKLKLKLFIIMGTACIWQSWPACLDVRVQLCLHDNGNHTGRCKLWAPVFRTSDSMHDYMYNWVQYMRQFTIDVVSSVVHPLIQVFAGHQDDTTVSTYRSQTLPSMGQGESLETRLDSTIIRGLVTQPQLFNSRDYEVLYSLFIDLL